MEKRLKEVWGDEIEQIWMRLQDGRNVSDWRDKFHFT
jgi:hypothetical protein